MSPLASIFLGLALLLSEAAAAQPSPAELISDFRLRQGEGRVIIDPVLNRIALEQAKAMASKDTLDHGVLGSFNSRIASSGSRHAAENIAYGYDSFEKTLDQWIGSAGHRKNLLLRHASRVGVASAKSPGTSRTYWAMVIAGGYQPTAPKSASAAAKKSAARPPCMSRILGVCF